MMWFSGVPTDVVESANDYTFYLDVPGFSSKNLKVQLDAREKLLMMSGVREDARTVEGERFLIRGREDVRRFRRAFQLPDDAELSSVMAGCEDGVLTVRVKKTAEEFGRGRQQLLEVKVRPRL